MPWGMPEDRVPERGTVLAFDFGERRVGAAVGEIGLGIARPLVTLSVRSDADACDQVAALVREWAPALLVVGLPSHQDGGEHALAPRCRRFAERIGRRFRLPVRLVDEHLSSHEASLSLAAAGVRGRQQKPLLDQVSAQVILESFFSARP